MEEMDGIEATRQIIEEWPEAKIIIVTSFLDDEKVYPALEAGATSYMLKTSKASEIADAVRATFHGQPFRARSNWQNDDENAQEKAA